jgi:hypothetical protein
MRGIRTMRGEATGFTPAGFLIRGSLANCGNLWNYGSLAVAAMAVLVVNLIRTALDRESGDAVGQ